MRSALAGRTPTSVLATNFNREGLSHREMATLLHEFGIRPDMPEPKPSNQAFLEEISGKR